MTPSRVTVPDRVLWALDVLDPDPAEEILEIGCGPGVAAGLVCERLETGRLLAVDRSAVATRRTAERNAEHVRSGRLVVRTVALDSLDLPTASLDTAFSVNVNLFWVRSPARELEILGRVLRPGGALHVCFGAGGPQAIDRITSAVAGALREHAFTDVSIISGESGIAVSARALG